MAMDEPVPRQTLEYWIANGARNRYTGERVFIRHTTHGCHVRIDREALREFIAALRFRGPADDMCVV